MGWGAKELGVVTEAYCKPWLIVSTIAIPLYRRVMKVRFEVKTALAIREEKRFSHVLK